MLDFVKELVKFMSKVNLLSQAEYAKHRGVSEAAVSKAIKANRITLQADGKVDPVAADAQWAQNSRVRASAGKPPGSAASAAAGSAAPAEQLALVPADPGAAQAVESKPGESGYWASRTRREQAEAEMAEMKLAEQQGELIRVAAVRTALAGVLSSTRDSLMQMPARLSPVLAAETDPARVHDALQEEINKCLGQLSALPARLVTTGAPA